jgi:transcriptional regulator with XRE-family HTH domain
MIGDNRRKKFSVVPNIAAMNEERREFASKIRAARALLGWSQAELGQRVGVTQRSINRLEQAGVDVRRSTAVAIEGVFRDEGVSFEMVPSGGFRILVQPRRRRVDRD